MELESYSHGEGGCAGTPGDCQASAGVGLSCDSRYRTIVGQLDVMISALRCEPGRNMVAELVHLLQRMRHDFGAECASMGLVAYPGAARHSLQHQSLCVYTAVLCHRLGKSNNLQPDELDDLRVLWLEHINVHDRAFEDFLTA